MPKHTVQHPSPQRLTNQPQTTRRRSNLTNLADLAHRALVPSMVLRAIIRTSRARASTIDRRMTRRADLKVGKLIKVNFNGISGFLLSNALDTLGALLHLCVAGPIKQGVGKVERGVELLVLMGKVHGGRERDGAVWAVELGDGEVGGEFEGALLVVVGETGDVGGALEEGSTLEFDGHGDGVLCCGVDCAPCLEFISDIFQHTN
jgi:hypothetical protein